MSAKLQRSIGRWRQRITRRAHTRFKAPIVFQTKSELAYQVLRKWILVGRLKPGQKLDQEWLAGAIGVSRMPLRQALLRLEADHLIQTEPHHSAIVAPLSAADVEDIYATRGALEGMLAEAGARLCTPEHLAAMAGCIRAQQTALSAGDIERFVGEDRRFHRTLYSASGYAKACEILERVRDMSDRYIRFYATYNHGATRSIEDHREILETCRRGPAEKVRQLIERHIGRGLLVLRALAQGQRVRGQC